MVASRAASATVETFGLATTKIGVTTPKIDGTMMSSDATMMIAVTTEATEAADYPRSLLAKTTLVRVPPKRIIATKGVPISNATTPIGTATILSANLPGLRSKITHMHHRRRHP